LYKHYQSKSNKIHKNISRNRKRQRGGRNNIRDIPIKRITITRSADSSVAAGFVQFKYVSGALAILLTVQTIHALGDGE
jgi:hypothetical protein